MSLILILFFFFNDTATTEIYTLSLHDALPILLEMWDTGLAHHKGAACVDVLHEVVALHLERLGAGDVDRARVVDADIEDRKSTRLNSSHSQISYAVFCLKKKKRKGRRPDAACH